MGRTCSKLATAGFFHKIVFFSVINELLHVEQCESINLKRNIYFVLIDCFIHSKQCGMNRSFDLDTYFIALEDFFFLHHERDSGHEKKNEISNDSRPDIFFNLHSFSLE